MKYSEFDLDQTIGATEEDAYLDRRDGFGARVYQDQDSIDALVYPQVGCRMNSTAPLLTADELALAEQTAANFTSIVATYEALTAHDARMSRQERAELADEIAGFRLAARLLTAALEREWGRR